MTCVTHSTTCANRHRAGVGAEHPLSSHQLHLAVLEAPPPVQEASSSSRVSLRSTCGPSASPLAPAPWLLTASGHQAAVQEDVGFNIPVPPRRKMRYREVK